MNKQLKEDGSIGKPSPYDFIDAGVIAERLKQTRGGMLLTVGLKFRNPRINDLEMESAEAIDWLLRHSGNYVFEAWYEGDDMLHVQALSGGDLL